MTSTTRGPTGHAFGRFPFLFWIKMVLNIIGFFFLVLLMRGYGQSKSFLFLFALVATLTAIVWVLDAVLNEKPDNTKPPVVSTLTGRNIKVTTRASDFAYVWTAGWLSAAAIALAKVMEVSLLRDLP
ncbi:MAG: hypothetical protein AAB719_01375 [Patescibacteria group bacterium]